MSKENNCNRETVHKVSRVVFFFLLNISHCAKEGYNNHKQNIDYQSFIVKVSNIWTKP